MDSLFHQMIIIISRQSTNFPTLVFIFNTSFNRTQYEINRNYILMKILHTDISANQSLFCSNHINNASSHTLSSVYQNEVFIINNPQIISNDPHFKINIPQL